MLVENYVSHSVHRTRSSSRNLKIVKRIRRRAERRSDRRLASRDARVEAWSVAIEELHEQMQLKALDAEYDTNWEFELEEYQHDHAPREDFDDSWEGSHGYDDCGFDDLFGPPFEDSDIIPRPMWASPIYAMDLITEHQRERELDRLLTVGRFFRGALDDDNSSMEYSAAEAWFRMVNECFQHFGYTAASEMFDIEYPDLYGAYTC
jgi:hypothetical protein